MTQLTLEQELALKLFESQVKRMTQEQAQQFLITLYEQMLVKEALYRSLLKHRRDY